MQGLGSLYVSATGCSAALVANSYRAPFVY